MQTLTFYLLYPFLMLISYIPLRVLYLLSSYLVYPILYYALGYRRKVVRKNLKNSFPEKTKNELNAIEKNFYKHLSDLFVEIMKSFTMSAEDLDARVRFENLEILDEYFINNRNVVLTLGHIGNYEWFAKLFPVKFKGDFYIPYRKMTNSAFDNFFKQSREKYGTKIFPTYETFDFLKRKKDKQFILGLANDQSAPPEKAFWVSFLNQDTSFFIGTEKIATQYDFPVLFGHISVPERGHYLVRFEKITDKPREEEEGFIMYNHAKLLEKDILENPTFWLWSHKRWKHLRPAGIGFGFNIEDKHPKQN